MPGPTFYHLKVGPYGPHYHFAVDEGERIATALDSGEDPERWRCYTTIEGSEARFRFADVLAMHLDSPACRAAEREWREAVKAEIPDDWRGA